VSQKIYHPHVFLLKTVSMIGKQHFAFLAIISLKLAVRVCASGALTTAGRQSLPGFSRGLTGGSHRPTVKTA
jgi:hypothetical protein